MKTEFLHLLTGGVSPPAFLFSFLCFFVGFGIFHTLTVSKGVRSLTNNTATKFDFWYWLSDNFKDWVLFLAVSYGTIRFTAEMLMITGTPDLLSQYQGSPFAFLAFGFGYEKINKALRKRFAPEETPTNKNMYEETPTPRNGASTTDGYALEYFDWRNATTDPWTKEVQYIEADATSPSGFWVYWRTFLYVSEFTSQTKDQFKTASFPRKPGKRGGTPSGQ